ncbi:hypothetical protein D3C74_141240 [compost metagenome]
MRQFLYQHWGRYSDRTIRFAKASFIINAVVGAGKILLGLYLMSYWFGLNGVYCILLCFARKIALKKYETAKDLSDRSNGYLMAHSYLKTTGVFLCLLSIIYFLVCNNLYLYGDTILFKGYLALLVALVSFLKLGFSIYGTIVTSRQDNPIAFGLKMLNLADALVSIVFTQYILLIFTESKNAVESSAFLGMVVSAILMIAGGVIFIKNYKSADPLKKDIE